MNKKVYILMCILVLLITGCKTVPGEKEKIDLNGMIYDTENRPVVNYRIYIDGKGMCTSDIGGRFVINRVQKGEHLFSGYGDGYLKIEERIVVYDKSQILYIRIPSMESKFKEAFELIKQNELDKAEKIIDEVLESDIDNKDAFYFMNAIEKLRGRNEKNLEQ